MGSTRQPRCISPKNHCPTQRRDVRSSSVFAS